MKLGHQFRAGHAGGQRIFDTVGAGSKDFGRDGRKENGGWEKGAPGLRPKGWRDVGLMVSQGSQAELDSQESEKSQREREDPESSLIDRSEGSKKPEGQTEKGIFTGLCVYINGSTAPAIGDHKLKHLLAEHGAHISIALGRRSVTHVIVGKPNDGRGGGAGGGLAGSKIQKEIQRVRGKGVKFVGVEWVIESVKAGKRLSEARFQGVSIAPKGVGSVYGLFKRKGEVYVGNEDAENEGVKTDFGDGVEGKGG